MKILNQATKYLAFYILLLVSLWSVVLYFVLMYEIKDSIDDGLDNYKLLILREAEVDATVLQQNEFDEGNYRIEEIDRETALTFTDYYRDTLMYMPFEDEMEPVRLLKTAFEQEGRYYSLDIISSMVEEDDLIRDMFWSVIILYLLIVISLILINNIVLRQLWRPFYKILEQLKNFKLGATPVPPPMQIDSREFSDLKLVTDNLIKRSIASFEQQKDFIGNAAHELQTPVSAAISRMELILERENLNPNLTDELAIIMTSLHRMRHLNKALLLLSKIENNQFPEIETFSATDVLDTLTDEFEDMLRYKSITIEHTRQQPCILTANKQLVNILLGNLYKNAIYHNTSPGRIVIESGQHTISISNTGAPTALDADRLFHRFYKSSTDQHSTGLGLAIVQAICKEYNYGIKYAFVEGMHRFTIEFMSNH